jgi:hypothetical protein
MLSVIWSSPDAAEVMFLIGFICAAVATVIALLARSVEFALTAAGVAFVALGLLAL